MPIQIIKRSEIPEVRRSRESAIREIVNRELTDLQARLSKHKLSPFEAVIITIPRTKTPNAKHVLSALLKSTKGWIKQDKSKLDAFTRRIQPKDQPKNRKVYEYALFVACPGPIS